VAVSRDEQALAASALVEGLRPDAPIGFAVVDEELRFQLVSGSLAAIVGRPVAEHIGRRVTEVLPMDVAARIEGLLAAVLDSGTALTGVELDGVSEPAPARPRNFVTAYHPIRLGERRLVGVVVVDVTDRRRAQEALAESERVLSGAQRMAGLGWWTWLADPERVVYAPELLSLMGRDPGLGGTPHARDRLELADPGELHAVREAGLAALASGRPFARRVRARRADGALRLLDARADVVYDAEGRAAGLQGFVQDITDLERAEHRQRIVAELGQAALAGLALDELMRRVVDAVGHETRVDGVAVLELLPDGSELTVRAAFAPVGYDGPWTVPVEPGSPSARALETRQPVVVDDLDGVHPYVRSPADRAAGARSAAAVVISGRGRPFGLLGAMSASPAHFGADDAAFLQALANVVADAVERRLAEAEIAEISAARGRLVAQALDGEERARRRVAETLHDGPLQELVAAGHELYALTGHGGDDDALQLAQERLGAIVRGLRDVMSALHPTVLQYAGLEAALRAVADQQAGAAGFEAALAVDPEAVGHRDELLLSVARELIGNAARHASAARVDVDLRRDGAALLLEVRDDGTGMDQDRPASAPAEGRIGLATCRERLEAVGGSLTIDGAPGGGTRARAVLPADEAPPADRTARISGLAFLPDRE
jgi:signal transduction histidine kinase/PAS domain-containing protein